MKKLIIFIVLFVTSMPAAMACKLCEEQQPSWLRNVIHGPGPRGPWDYVIMYAGIAFVLVVLFYSVKFLVKPGEKDHNHIKYSILNSKKNTYGEQG